MFFFRGFSFFPFNQCRDLLTVQILRPQPVASLANRPFKGQCSQAAVLTLFTPHEGGCTYTCTHTCISQHMCGHTHTCAHPICTHDIQQAYSYVYTHYMKVCVTPLVYARGVHTCVSCMHMFGHMHTKPVFMCRVSAHIPYAHTRVHTQSYLCLFSHHTRGLEDTGVFSLTPTDSPVL